MQNQKLLEPIKIGDVTYTNRVVMAALTRMRCDTVSQIPNELHQIYYAQRANAGFILSECSAVSRRSNAFPGNPGIYNQDHVEGWKQVTDAVHKAGGKIFIQIWHSGRATNSVVQEGLQPWAPSPIAIRSKNRLAGDIPYDVPHEMTLDEINIVKEEFRVGAINAKQAGFDGVQLHGAHGYLVDQFLKSYSNRRTDIYGGSVENRARFCLEVIDILIEVFGAQYTGIKVTPIGRYNDAYDSDPIELYTYLFKELEKRKVAFIELKDDNDPENDQGFDHPSSRSQIPNIYEVFKPYYHGVIIGNCNFTPEQAEKYISEGLVHMVSFGRLYINNPDLVARIKNNWKLNTDYDYKTFYFGGSKGYLDFPNYEQENQTQSQN